MERQTHNLLVAGSNPAGPTLFVFVFVGSKNGVVLGFGWLVGCCWFSSLGFLFLVCSLVGRGLGSGVVGPVDVDEFCLDAHVRVVVSYLVVPPVVKVVEAAAFVF